MIKISQCLTLQESPKHPGLVRRLLKVHQVLNLMEGHHPEGGKAAKDLKILLMTIACMIFFNRSVITVLYVERTVAIYGCCLF
jgi:hypothetical protein